ncbi:MAG: putative transcriptional regulator [Microgenomates group bacterium GW2011_GWC1_39_12]|nr:MAG: putative transcriptional regulator [Microgenomates group bacterium GW2011_GWC1_39_12]
MSIKKIKVHERTSKKRVGCLACSIKTDGVLKRPIIVDRKSYVVLDGHHRIEALRQIGAIRVPAFLVDYQNKHVRVYLRKKYLMMHLIKQAVLQRGSTGNMFPAKTTRHLIHNRPGAKRFSLKELLP